MGNGTIAAESFRLPLENGLYLEGEVRVPSGTGGDEGDSKGRLPVVILSHGFRGHKDWAFWPESAGRLAESGFYTVSFNFSRIAARRLAEAGAGAGTGGSAEAGESTVRAEKAGNEKYSGSAGSVAVTGVKGTAGTEGIAAEPSAAEQLAAEAATLTRELQDLELLLGSLKEGRLPLAGRADTGRIGILGHSRAGGGNIIFAAEHPEVNALVVWNGGSPPARTTQDSAGEPTLLEQILERDQELNRERFNIEQALERVTVPALIIQGARDRASLLEQNTRFREQAPQHRYAGVSGADHTFNTTDPYEGPTAELKEALALTLEFLQEKLG
ncbi:alpha/beta hydrolase family protein [Paenibacillus typhae]|uniref:alpha/beta hydrolase family protein n=1 Tax=Paenibacillus typhae TaxID=1174501 RepID=UPI001C8EFE53|nr:alpha/beta hydrolase [Paenibacillus typhae]MBY0013979.1 alpha/beta hydrolase [Paenibacillus typhae]